MSDTQMITLYAAMDSLFPHRVLLALEEAGATYDIIWIDLMNKEEWFEKKVNPAGGKVPFLVYGGPKLHPGEAPSTDAVRISESRVILEFLADIFPAAHLLPSDAVLRARARRFITTVDEKLIKTLVGFLFLGAPLENLLAILEELQAVLPPTGFVVGDWSIADACFIPALVRVRSWLEAALGNYTLEVAKEGVKALHSPRFARLQKYYDDAKARPSTAKTWNEKEVKLSFSRRMDRFYKTGIVNSELRIPVPSA